MPGDPQESRQLARDCLRLAEEATSDPARQDYIALAYTWTELANVFESDNALLELECRRIECRAAPTATAHQAKGRVRSFFRIFSRVVGRCVPRPRYPLAISTCPMVGWSTHFGRCLVEPNRERAVPYRRINILPNPKLRRYS